MERNGEIGHWWKRDVTLDQQSSTYFVNEEMEAAHGKSTRKKPFPQKGQKGGPGAGGALNIKLTFISRSWID